MIDVVIPARNEADTIGPIIAAFRAVPFIGTIIVVCDNCTDDTKIQAAYHHINVITGDYGGKGEALTRGLDDVETDNVIFCDADLTGLTPESIQTFACHCPWMTVGVPDWPGMSPVPWPVRMDIFAQMSGQRCLPTWLARSVPLVGYTVEAFLNRQADREGIPVRYIRTPGVRGKIRHNERRMAELRRDREWMTKHW